jgi:hypothetical protein
LKEEEERNLREFAINNGFNVKDFSNKKRDLIDLYEEAANFKITKVSI